MQTKTVKKILIGTVALAGGTALLTVGAFDCLMRYAVARKRPRLMRSVARVVANNMAGPEALQTVHEADKALAGKVHTIVEINASLDGIRLIGHWLPVENAKRIVIAAHGWRSTWSESFGGIADTLAKQGCSVLYLDQRGQNGSGGKTIGLGLLERYDCLDWVAWCCRQCGGTLPVYLYGISMGAASVMLSAGLDLPKEVHGIIADCGYTSPKALLNDVLHRLLHMRARFWECFPNAIYRLRVGVRSDESTVQEALHGQKIPLLLIHGQADRLASPKMSERIYKSYCGPKYDYQCSYLACPYEACQYPHWIVFSSMPCFVLKETAWAGRVIGPYLPMLFCCSNAQQSCQMPYASSIPLALLRSPR